MALPFVAFGALGLLDADTAVALAAPQDDLQDAVAAVNHPVAKGRVDGQRVAIRGGSAGGFTVLSALAFSTRFAAGINCFGVADLALEGEGHGFRQGPNIVRALQCELVFLGRVFGFRPAGALPALQIDNHAALG